LSIPALCAYRFTNRWIYLGLTLLPFSVVKKYSAFGFIFFPFSLVSG